MSVNLDTEILPWFLKTAEGVIMIVWPNKV